MGYSQEPHQTYLAVAVSAEEMCSERAAGGLCTVVSSEAEQKLLLICSLYLSEKVHMNANPLERTRVPIHRQRKHRV